MPGLSTAERFWAKVYKGSPSGCWLWTGGSMGHGYGCFKGGSIDHSRYAHRWAWILTHGPVPVGLCVRHRCNTRNCVRPEHLILGTQADNVLDMLTAGRASNGHAGPKEQRVVEPLPPGVSTKKTHKPPAPSVRRVCQRCGKRFLVIASRATEERGRFCGTGCRRPHSTDAERFWSYVAKGTETECWLWTGARMKTGYGGFNVKGVTLRAHRLAWEAVNGPIPDGLCVLHRCDVRLCVNPAHLFLGTYADNNADMRGKGRANEGVRPRGTEHGNAKLTDSDVLEIRRRYALNSRYGACQALANEFGVSRRAIYQIVRRIVWTHI